MSCLEVSKRVTRAAVPLDTRGARVRSLACKASKKTKQKQKKKPPHQTWAGKGQWYARHKEDSHVQAYMHPTQHNTHTSVGSRARLCRFCSGDPGHGRRGRRVVRFVVWREVLMKLVQMMVLLLLLLLLLVLLLLLLLLLKLQ